MELRPYQSNLVQGVREAFADKARAPLMVLGTGGGKTVIFSHIALNAAGKGKRTWIVAHRKELINQASKTLRNFEVPHGIIKSGVHPMPWLMTQAASVQSLGSRIGRVEAPDLIVFDECHHATSNTYRRIIDAYPSAKILGVTATPCRLDGKGLGDIFDRMILGPTIRELTAEGFLAPVRYFAPPQKADLSGVKITRGDYSTTDLEGVMNQRAITGDAVGHYRQLCDGVPMLVFCVSVKHAKDVAAQYAAAGYRATYVHGDLSDSDREDRILGLGTGKYQIVTSCDLIGEGLDVPIVVAAQLLRPTASLIIHLQQIGRVLRPADGKDFAYVLDHVGNLAEHGFAETEREWSLDGKKKRRKVNGEKDVVIRACTVCYLVHEPAPACPFCGFVYPIHARKLEVVAGSLQELTAIDKVVRKQEVAEARTLSELIAIGKARGYKNPSFWARQLWFARQAGGRRLFT